MAKKRYEKLGGGVLILADGKKINSGDKFVAEENEIPETFKKSLRFLANVPVKDEKPAKAETPKDPPITEKSPAKDGEKLAAKTNPSKPKSKATRTRTRTNKNS